MDNPFKGPNYSAPKASTPVANPFKGPAEPTKKKEEPKANEKSWLDNAGQFGFDTLVNFNNALTLGLFPKALEATGIDPMAEERVQQSNPVSKVIGDTAGYMATGGGLSTALGKVVPALGKMTLGSVVGNNAATSAVMSAGEDFIDDGQINPLRTIIDTALGGVTAGGVHVAMSKLPGNMVRSMGNDLTDADRAGAMGKYYDAADVGIPLTVPEAVQAAAPAKGKGLLAGWDDAANSPKGSVVAAGIESARTPLIKDAGRRVVADLGGGADPADIMQLAKTTLLNERNALEAPSKAWFKQAAKKKVPPTWIPKTPAVAQATDDIASDPNIQWLLRQENGGQPVQPNSLAFLDQVRKKIAAEADNAYERHPALGEALDQQNTGLTSRLDQVSSEYQLARDQSAAAKAEMDAMEAGPLGTLSKTSKTGTESSSLFGVKTDVDRIAAQAALRRLEQTQPGVGKGLLANHVDQQVSADPQGFGRKVFPNEYSQQVGEQAMGTNAGTVQQTLDAAAAVNPQKSTPTLGEHSTGIGGSIWRYLHDIGKGGVVKRLNDPDWIKRLGRVSPVQRGITLGITGALQGRDPITHDR